MRYLSAILEKLYIKKSFKSIKDVVSFGYFK